MIEIPVNKIIANKYQPREYFDDEKLMNLANSIRENGLIQPITVRKKEDMYEIISGERRFRALCLLGKTVVNAIVMEKDDIESAKLALIENLQREDLSAIEIAKSYEEILTLTNTTQSQLATQLGVSQSGIANKLRLLKLDDFVQNFVIEGKIGERHARALIDLDVKTQKRFAKKVVKENWTVDQLEKKLKPKQQKEKSIFKGYSNDMRIAINTVNKAIQDATAIVKKVGIQVAIEQKSLEDEHVIVIKLKK